MEFLKKSWKVLAAAGVLCVALIGTGVYLRFAVAASGVDFNTISASAMVGDEDYVYGTSGDHIKKNDTGGQLDLTLSVSLTGNDKDTAGEVIAYNTNNIYWTVDNSNVLTFPGGYARGDEVTAVVGNSGICTVTAVYYYDESDDSNFIIIDSITGERKRRDLTLDEINALIASGEAFPLKSATYTVDLGYNNSMNDLPNGENTVFEPGSTFYLSGANTRALNISFYPDGIAHANMYTNGDGATIAVTGGGITTATVYIAGAENGSGGYLLGLSKEITIKGRPVFDSSYTNPLYTITDPNTGIAEPVKLLKVQTNGTQVLSNIVNGAGVVYRSTNDDIAYITNGVVHYDEAGVAKVTAGLLDENGEFIEGSTDDLYIQVPLEWKNTIANMNVGDVFTLECNGGDNVVSWNSDNTDVVTVTDAGVITAVSNGTATITASISGNNGYGFDFTDGLKITTQVNVIDSFALSASTADINVGDTLSLRALITSNASDLSFKVYKIVDNELTEITSSADVLVFEQDPDNPAVLNITGVAPGTFSVVATQVINGLVKTAECKLYVRTPVEGVELIPVSTTVDRGSEVYWNLKFNPSDPYNKDVVWVSSNEDVAKVVDGDFAGATIQGVSGGKATITVITIDGLYVASAEIYVREPVTGIELNETNVVIHEAAISFQLVATVLPAGDGVNRNVIWTSSDESVLTVSQTGLVTFLKSGYATVVAKTEDGGYTATCNFHVSVPVETVSINVSEIILSKGDTYAFTAEVLPLTASNRTVEWISSDENVIKIDSNGFLTAVGAGQATVICRSLDGGITDYCSVYVRQPVASISMNTTEMSVRKGAEFWLYCSVLPENADDKTVTWTSSDENLATVDSDGKVIALNPGIVTITATSNDSGLIATCIVTITEPVTSITLKTGYSETLVVGSKYTIVPEVLPIDAADKSVTYMSTDNNIATVTKDGVVTALQGGKCDIIVTTNERQLTAVCSITVKEYLSSITFDKTSSYINIGESIQIIATTETATATNKNIIWSSDNTNVATVDRYGNVYGKNYGTTVITATADDGGGAMATCVVTVVEPVRSISLDPTTLELLQGDTYIINASIDPSDASVQTLQWTSSDTSVATVDSDGEVTAVAGGKCKITATSTDGNEVKATATVYVTTMVNSTSIAISSQNVSLKVGDTRKLTAKTTPVKVTEGLGWISSDTSIATVDGNGNVTGVSEGTVKITVYGLTSGVEGTCTVTVTDGIKSATAIKLNSSNITMLAGKSRVLETMLYPRNATEGVTWYSTDTSVVTVDANGKITTVGPGSADVIAVTSKSGLEAVCTVYSLALNTTAVTLQQYDPFQMYVDGAPSGVSWRTSNPRVATVSSTGEIIGRKPGTVIITATVDDKTLTCKVTITEATID